MKKPKKKTDAEVKEAVAPKVQGKLREPFPSSPKNPPICEVRVTHDERDMMHLHTFAAWYSAKAFINALTEDRKVKEINDNVIKTDDGIKIKSPQLQDILGYKMNALEEEWVLPSPYNNMVRMFRGEKYKKEDMEQGIINTVMKPDQKREGQVGPTRIAGKGPNHQQQRKERTPRPPKDGYVSIGDIATELKTDPRICRGILRDAKQEKPDGGWAWKKGDKQIEVIKKIITKGLKDK